MGCFCVFNNVFSTMVYKMNLLIDLKKKFESVDVSAINGDCSNLSFHLTCDYKDAVLEPFSIFG